MIIKDVLNCEKRKVDIYNFSQRIDLFNIENCVNYYLSDDNINNTRFEVFEIYNQMSDSRRGVWLYSVYFDNEPIAIWYEAGREGDDSKKGFVLNRKKFVESIKYLESFNDYDDIEEFDINKDLQALDYVYGHDMTKELFNYNFDLKYKVDDIVILEQINEVYPEITEKNIVCKIIDIDNKSSAFTYQLELIDYKQIPYFDKNNGHKVSYKIFKKLDVLHYNEMMSEEHSYGDFDERQKEIINDFFFNKIVSPKVTLGYIEENLIKSL